MVGGSSLAVHLNASSPARERLSTSGSVCAGMQPHIQREGGSEGKELRGGGPRPGAARSRPNVSHDGTSPYST